MGIVSTTHYKEACLCCTDDVKLLQVSFLKQLDATLPKRHIKGRTWIGPCFVYISKNISIHSNPFLWALNIFHSDLWVNP